MGEVTNEEVKAAYLRQKYGEETAQIVAREIVEELSELPKGVVPYIERREKFWRDVKSKIENPPQREVLKVKASNLPKSHGG